MGRDKTQERQKEHLLAQCVRAERKERIQVEHDWCRECRVLDREHQKALALAQQSLDPESTAARPVDNPKKKRQLTLEERKVCPPGYHIGAMDELVPKMRVLLPVSHMEEHLRVVVQVPAHPYFVLSVTPRAGCGGSFRAVEGGRGV